MHLPGQVPWGHVPLHLYLLTEIPKLTEELSIKNITTSNIGVRHDFFDELKGVITFFDGLKGGSLVVFFFFFGFCFCFCSFIFKSGFLCLTMFFLNILVWESNNFWRKWVMKLHILCPLPTKYKIFLGKGALPLTTLTRGPDPWTPANTSLTNCPSHKHAQRLGDSQGKCATLGNLKLVVAWNPMEMVYKWRNHCYVNYVNFTLWNRFSWAFKTLKSMSFRGFRPLDPSATTESPMKIVHIDNSVRNYIYMILPPILPS